MAKHVLKFLSENPSIVFRPFPRFLFDINVILRVCHKYPYYADYTNQSFTIFYYSLNLKAMTNLYDRQQLL